MALWAHFTGQAEGLSATVMRTASEQGALGFLRNDTRGFACTASAAQRYPAIASAASHGASDRPAEIVTAALFAVAETGSVALNEPQADRGACFLAERLWLLVRETDIVPGLEEALARLRDAVKQGAHHPLLMSGPSRTADIERTLTVGVHGPRALTIVVLGGR